MSKQGDGEEGGGEGGEVASEALSICNSLVAALDKWEMQRLLGGPYDDRVGGWAEGRVGGEGVQWEGGVMCGEGVQWEGVVMCGEGVQWEGAVMCGEGVQWEGVVMCGGSAESVFEAEELLVDSGWSH